MKIKQSLTGAEKERIFENLQKTLLELRFEKNMNMEQVARELKVSTRQVKIWLEQLDMPLQKPSKAINMRLRKAHKPLNNQRSIRLIECSPFEKVYERMLKFNPKIAEEYKRIHERRQQ